MQTPITNPSKQQELTPDLITIIRIETRTHTRILV
jgi:hypothetical protein